MYSTILSMLMSPMGCDPTSKNTIIHKRWENYIGNHFLTNRIDWWRSKALHWTPKFGRCHQIHDGKEWDLGWSHFLIDSYFMSKQEMYVTMTQSLSQVMRQTKWIDTNRQPKKGVIMKRVHVSFFGEWTLTITL